MTFERCDACGNKSDSGFHIEFPEFEGQNEFTLCPEHWRSFVSTAPDEILPVLMTLMDAKADS